VGLSPTSFLSGGIMRGFELQDTFKLSEIIDVMDIQLDLNKLLDQAKGSDNAQAKVGGELALLVLKRLYKADKQIVEFIASITEETEAEIKKYKPKQIKAFFVDLFNNEDFADFFA
jgi:hypothetical protein